MKFQYFQTALTLHLHYYHFNTFTVIFQPQCESIYNTTIKHVFDCTGPLNDSEDEHQSASRNVTINGSIVPLFPCVLEGKDPAQIC
jgi:hypothetical protein